MPQCSCNLRAFAGNLERDLQEQERLAYDYEKCPTGKAEKAEHNIVGILYTRLRSMRQEMDQEKTKPWF